jgi:aspartyl protease family protein
MLRLALIIIFVGTLVGALMPSSLTSSLPSGGDEKRETISVSEPSDSASSNQPAFEVGSGPITLDRERDGHFYAEARVNGAAVRFLIDTGASGIALDVSDARRAGLAIDPGQVEVIGTGPSGEIRGHFVRLNRVELGLKAVSDIPAVVLESGDRSLLGQSFLSQFGSLEIHGNTMVLR